MKERNFKSFASIKEIECSAATLPQELRYVSLTLFKQSQSQQQKLAFLETSEKTCKTFDEYASCGIDANDKRRSWVRTLIADLKGKNGKNGKW